MMRYLIKIIATIMFLIGIVFNSFSQDNLVTVSVNVLPPYTPYLSDYIENPNKVMVTLVLTSPTGSPMDVYLRGSFSSSDSGINIYTDPSLIPSIPIQLENGIPYQLSADELSAIYGLNNVIFEGITAEDIMSDGSIPEGFYQLCVQAFQYDTVTPVSAAEPNGCSNLFLISNIDPPYITNPICGDEILEQNPQNILISWVPPPAANPASLSYLFRMIEIPDGIDLDLIDAINNPNYASIFEEETIGNMAILLTNDKVQLIPNNTYVFTVQALSDGIYNFKNDGVSEPCWFVYKEQKNNLVLSPIDNTNAGDFQEQFELLPATKVSGRLFYKLPENGQTTMSYKTSNTIPKPLKNVQPITTGINYSDLSKVTGAFTGSPSTNHVSISNSEKKLTLKPNTFKNISFKPKTNSKVSLAAPFGRGLINKETESINTTKPLANTEIRLVVRLAVFDKGEAFPSYREHPKGNIQGRGAPVAIGLLAIKDIDNKEHFSNPKFINMVLDVTKTDDNGNYSFDFRNDFYTAPCQVTTNSASVDIYADQELEDFKNTGEIIINPYDAFQGFEMNPNQELQTEIASQLATQFQAPNSQHQQEQYQTRSGVIPNVSSALLAYICLKVEVVNQKFCSPDVDIFAMPGDNVDVGNQVALIKTYNAKITVKSDDTSPQILLTNEGIPNTKIKILRNINDLAKEHPAILKEEGQKLDSRTFTIDGEFKDVNLGETSGEPNKKGELTLYNLVKHWSGGNSGFQASNSNFQIANPVKKLFVNRKSPYLISVATRQAELVSSNYENTFYNYKSHFDYLETKPDNDVDTPYDNQPTTYNHSYANGVPTVNFEYIIEPNKPEIKGRVMAHSNIENVGIADATIILFKQSENKAIDNLMGSGLQLERQYSPEINGTEESGFFRFTDLPINSNGNDVAGPYRRLMIVKQGYKPKYIPRLDQKPYNLTNGLLVDLKDINLETAYELKGKVVNEEGQPVKAYVKVLEDGPYYKTFTNPFSKIETFNIAAATSGNKIRIEPLSSQYFKKDFENVDITEAQQTFKVYKKLHRIYLTVKGPDEQPVMNAKVVVGDSLAYGETDSHGVFKKTFASPDDQFVLKINANNFAPEQSILDLEVSENWTYLDKKLTPAFSIFGYISDAETKAKIPDAKVFAEIDNTDGHHLYLESKTDAEGYYTLNGIPWEYRSLELHISKDGNTPSYIGLVEEVDVGPYNREYYNFELSHLDGWDLTQILGFPMQVEGYKTDLNNSNRIFIKGYLHNMPVTNGFKTQEADSKVSFNGWLVEKDANGKISPVANSNKLNEIQIPIKINNIFTGMLQEPKVSESAPTSTKKLELKKLNNRTGVIKSAVKIDLESFRTAYSFDGDFYVGDNVNSYAATVFKTSSNMIQLTKPKRPIFDIKLDLNQGFKPFPIKNYIVHEFRADSELEDSYLEGSLIRLNTILHTDIPMGSNPDLDLKIPIGTVIVSQNDIYIDKADSDDIKFKLENWDVIAKEKWEFNKNEGAIVLPKVLINSQKGFSATVKNMRIRPKALKEGKVDLNEGLSLGGIAPLTFADGITDVLFNYDEGVGDGHYRISIIGETDQETIARIDSNILSGTNDDIEFNSIGLLSNDVAVLNLNKNMRFYDILNVNVSQIITGDGFFSLLGAPNFNKVNNGIETNNTGIPGYNPTPTIITYHNPNSLGVLDIKIDQLKGDINCGYDVVFRFNNDQENKNQVFSQGLFEAKGDLIVSPSANDLGNKEDSFTLKSDLTVSTNDRIIDIEKNTDLKFGDVHKMIIDNGRTFVKNNKWETLKFNAKPDATTMKGLEADNVFKFEVSGNVSVTNDELKVEKVNLGKHGKASLVFNFEDPSIDGSYFYNGKVVESGYFSFSDPKFAFRFSPEGFYQAGGGKITLFQVLDFPSALLIGYTTEDITSHANEFLSGYRAIKPSFSNGLKGFYTIGAFRPDWANKELTLIPKVATAKVGLEVGVTTEFNFAGDNEYTIAGYGFAEAAGIIKAKVAGVGCEVGIGGESFLLTEGKYKENEGLTFRTYGNLKVPIFACGFSVSKSIFAEFGINEDGEDYWNIDLN